jgi:RNA polymerase sigma-70 factor (ECF subfamily)
MKLESDERLINKALDGSQRAWSKLVGRYETQVYNQALRITRNRADAMDLMQETFLAVYRNLPNYRGDGSFPGWVSRIAINRAIDFQRHRARQPEQATIDISEILGGESPAKLAGQSQRNRNILRLLDNLSTEQRAVIELKFFQQCTFEDIAQQLGISSNTAKTRLYAALSHLQKNAEVSHAL